MSHDILLKIGSIVLLLGGLIFVHELGHFLVAKALRVKVLRFSIGFGPKLLGIRRGETEYLLSLLPLGGYVKMAGDDPSEEPKPEDRGRGFLEQRPWRRFLIAAAGPAMNLIFPALIYFVIALAQNGSPVPGPRIGTVSPGSPAAQAGLEPGDRIVLVEVPGRAPAPIQYFTDLRDLVSPHPSEPLIFTVVRKGRTLPPITIIPAPEQEENPLEITTRGVIGVTPAYVPATAAPVSPGAAGPLAPFDLIVKAADQPIAHWGDLEEALAKANCAPIRLEVRREEPGTLSGATPSSVGARTLEEVPTCVAGKPSWVATDPAVSTFIATVTPGSPAAQAGLQRGDAISAWNGTPVRSFRDIESLASQMKPGEPIRITLTSGRSVNLVPGVRTDVDEITGETKERPVVGFLPDQRSLSTPEALIAELVPRRTGPITAARLATKQLGEVIRLTALGVARIAQGIIPFKTVGGPIMLFSIAAKAAKEGLESFLFTMALISVNLGLMNLLPIPVLDGGHIVACLLEGVTRRPMSMRTREIANLVGIILLVFLMILVFKNDIARIIG